jgi:uncharacterized protein (UPF0297 family)
MNSLKIIFIALLIAILPQPSFGQSCRWDGTAPWCAGACRQGETEVFRASELPPHWADAFPVVQNTNFGAACVLGTKTLCCPASAGSECRWDGTAPFCDGECRAGEVAATPPAGIPSGAACVTGSKKWCCRARVSTGSVQQRLTTNPKLSLFAAIWDKSSGPAWQARHGLTSAQYQQVFNELGAQGYRPIDVSGYSVGGGATYAAIFEKRSAPEFAAFHGLPGARYQEEFNRLTGAGFRPIHIAGYTVGGQDQYAAIFEKSRSEGWVARHNIDAATYQREFDRWTGQGYRLVVVSGYNINGQDRYAAIWEKRPSPPWTARHGLSSTQYQQQFNELAAQGYRVVKVNGWRAGDAPHFAAIWEKTGGPAWQARHQMLADGYQEEFDRLLREGYRLRDISGYHMYD